MDDSILVVKAVLGPLRSWAATQTHVLSAAEQSRTDRYRFDRDRSRFVVSRVVLRTVLGRYLSLDAGGIAFDDWCYRCSRHHAKP